MPNAKDQGRKGNATNTKYTSPRQSGPEGKRQHTPRPMTDKFDCYRVPVDQAQNLAGTTGGQFQQQQPQFQEYYHFEQKIQATNTGQPAGPAQIIQPVAQPVYYTVPYSKLQYNYETYGHQAVPPGSAFQQNATSAGYPLPQVDPNYYNYPGQGGGPYTAYGYPKMPPQLTGNNGLYAAKRGRSQVNYGHAPYASPWATEERPKSPFSRPPPLSAPLWGKTNDHDEVMQKVIIVST